jgi:hypothetical protein
MDAYMRLAGPQVSTADPMKQIETNREFVEGIGAKLEVGIWHRVDALAGHLQAIGVSMSNSRKPRFFTKRTAKLAWRVAQINLAKP